MTNPTQINRVGEVRPSQLMFTYGVGALVDLPKVSVIVSGLDDWQLNPEYCHTIAESRLLQAVQFHLPNVEKMVTPPLVTDDSGDTNPDSPTFYVGVPVATFPRWMVCPRCRLLAPLSSNLFKLDASLYHPDQTCYRHTNCLKWNEPEVLPARFLAACEKGHLDDFHWVEFVHRGKETVCNAPQLRLLELGPSGEARNLEVSCENCKAKRRMNDAFGIENRAKLPECTGRRPHLRDHDSERCELPIRTITLGASNTWFPVSLSAIAIPVSADIVMQLVEEKWSILSAVKEISTIEFLRNVGNLGRLSQYPDLKIFEAIQAFKNQEINGGTRRTKPDLKTPEWKVFVEHDSMLNDGENFKLRAVLPPSNAKDFLKQVVLVERLREVTALVGFTRIDSGGEQEDPELDIPTSTAPLSRNAPTWVPASEVRGEGIFVEFNEERIQAWLEKKEIQERNALFFEAHKKWCETRGIEDPAKTFPGMRYILLHSFSHALMRQLSLECGYAAASIRERIYSSSPTADKTAMAGILIYTSAPDSEGTLGGLVNLGEPENLGLHIAQALEHAQLCASDPLCAEHAPSQHGRTIHGAACHACLFSPETSCERGNRYLDRSTLAKTVEQEFITFFNQA
ncbi:MAG TPA: DUF1998 domain-containing protein [Anaerolineales bacterium]|nr:DUF1998 domain-containing protein [Anaerolineales bacterium]